MSELIHHITRQHRSLANGAYPEHAAEESIRAYLDDALDARIALDAYIGWLQALQGRRSTEKRLGAWPPAPRETARADS